MTIWHFVGHATVALPGTRGIDPSAWVSAGAAVVQAAGAVATIWFTGKAARDAARREAEGANRERARRISAYNRPIDRAIELGERVMKEFADKRRAFSEKVSGGERAMYAFGSDDAQRLALEQLPEIRQRTDDISVAAEMQALQAAVGLVSAVSLDAGKWISVLDRKTAEVDKAVEALRSLRQEA